MAISVDVLNGYLLEEALAFLLMSNGYSLLVDESQDPIELKNGSNGLLVKGRGTYHQADSLGELIWIPTFNYPIRLFVEAKYRGKKTDLGTVRNAIGVLTDLNQNMHLADNHNLLSKRYNYNYALFSTNGFTKNAVDLAIAHGISLIDLNNCGLTQLLIEINNASESIIRLVESDNFQQYTQKRVYAQIRNIIRFTLGTTGNNRELIQPILVNDHISNQLNTLLYQFYSEIRSVGKLAIATVKGPFIIVLKSANIEDFYSYCIQNPKHNVNITWNSYEDQGRIWTITPEGRHQERYQLKFNLPKLMADYVFKDDPLRRAINLKEEFMSEISVLYQTSDQDYIFRLKYVPRQL